MKFKVGDVVKVKSLDWYNENKNESGNVYFDENTFVAGMRKFCNKCATIVNLNFELYEIDIDDRAFNWTDEMFEDEPVQITPELSTGGNNLPEHQTQKAWETQVDGNHYIKLAIQPMEYSMKNNLNCLQHTIIKYVTRYKDKKGKLDLEKAIHCLQMLIEMEYGNESN